MEKEPIYKSNLEEAELKWNDYKGKITKLRSQVQSNAVEKLGEDGNEWWQQKFIDFADNLKTNVPNYDKCIAWHSLIGSSTDYGLSPKEDLPEPYNIKSFCISLIDELENVDN